MFRIFENILVAHKILVEYSFRVRWIWVLNTHIALNSIVEFKAIWACSYGSNYGDT